MTTIIYDEDKMNWQNNKLCISSIDLRLVGSQINLTWLRGHNSMLIVVSCISPLKELHTMCYVTFLSQLNCILSYLFSIFFMVASFLLVPAISVLAFLFLFSSFLLGFSLYFRLI